MIKLCFITMVLISSARSIPCLESIIVRKYGYYFQHSRNKGKTHWAKWCTYASISHDITGSDNGLLPVWHQAITWNNVDILPIGPVGTNFSKICIKLQTFPFRKIDLQNNGNFFSASMWWYRSNLEHFPMDAYIDSILPKGPYPPC